MLKITYNGLDYSQIDNPLQIALLERTEGFFLKLLQPLQSEIEETGGFVRINVPKDFSRVHVGYEQLPPTLERKIGQQLRDYML